MIQVSTDINHHLREPATDPVFPYAPPDWTKAEAIKAARAEGVELTEAHWEAIRALQIYYAQHDDAGTINLRELHDALDEHFHPQGGLKYLYTLFPAGPVAQSCRFAGLKAPFIATDASFGSVA
ncbi:MAG: TusE/DsrC/DsvC family sulfur relay protein [Pseudomonadota bacterium]